MADENLHGLPISSLPKADELNQTDQLIAYREDDGKAYRSNVGALAEASTANIGDAFATTVQYNAGDYCIYNDTLYKFTDFKDIGSWDDSVVEKVTVADEIKSNTEKIQENTDLIDSLFYEPGDSVTLQWRGAGYTTSSSSTISFSLTLPKSTQKISSIQCSNCTYALRSDNAYVGGTSSNCDTSASSVTINQRAIGVIYMLVTLSNTTNVPNNSVVGLQANLTLQFS